MQGTTNDIFAKHYMNFAKSHILEWTKTGLLDSCRTHLEEAKLAILLSNQKVLISNQALNQTSASLIFPLTVRIVMHYIPLETFWPIIYDPTDEYLNLTLPVKDGTVQKVPVDMGTLMVKIDDIIDPIKNMVEYNLGVDAELEMCKLIEQRYDESLKLSEQLKTDYMAVFSIISNDFYHMGRIDTVGTLIKNDI